MSAIQEELAFAAYNRACALVDYKIHDNLEKQHEFLHQTIISDESLTKDGKSEAIKLLNKEFDYRKILYNEGTKRICENCLHECLATLYCENCIRNYLKANFSNWTSGNNDIDNLIQKCQMETIAPNMIVEWIPYNHLRKIKFLTKGGCSEIYTADWVNGHYIEWNSKKQQLKRFGGQKVILKRLKNVESANRSWFDEGKSHLTISNKYGRIVPCYGITKDPSDGNYMLVMNQMDITLRKYLQQNYHRLTWKERIQIISDIIFALSRIHYENAIHRDLHSGNILFNQSDQRSYISDLGFCGPADKPLSSIYGSLPNIAPEVIAGKEYTFKSDIYSVAMLMWEISSGKPPFSNFNYCENDENDNYLAQKIINGIRPKIIPGTPLEYEKIMKKCWDADPLNRPDVFAVSQKIREISLSYQNMTDESNKNENVNTNRSLFKKIKSFQLSELKTNNLEINGANNSFLSKVYQFEKFPEPRNATEEEQEVFYSKPYSFCTTDDDIKSFNQSNTLKSNNVFRGGIKKLTRVFRNTNLNDKTQNSYSREAILQLKNDNERFNHSNPYLEEQDELEIHDNRVLTV